MDKLLDIGWVQLAIPTHSIAEMLLRGTVMYLALFLILRFLMKRQAGGIGIADILVIVVIADAAQNAFAKEYKSLTEGVVLILTIVFWDHALDRLSYRFPAFGRVMRPPPLLLVDHGRIVPRSLRQESITTEELMSQLRQQGVENVTDVKKAYMEADGTISVIKNEESRASTRGKTKRPGT